MMTTVGAEKSPSGGRYPQIDSMRTLAAVAVLWQHVAEIYSAAFPAVQGQRSLFGIVPGALHLSHIGVIVFFMISGFVIAPSLRGPRRPGLRKFWIRRVFRLYPAYWLSLIVGYAIGWRLFGNSMNSAAMLANIAMLQHPFGQPAVLGVYWTLASELYFYALCSLWFAFGWLHNPRFLALVALLGVIFPVGKVPYNLGVMHFGALFRQAYDEPGHTEARRLALGLALALLIRPSLGFLQGGNFTAFFAVPIFCLGCLYLPRNGKILAGLGEASYSMYLFHGPVFILGLYLLNRPEVPAFWRSLPLVVYILAVLAITVAVSLAVYRLVEKPAMNLARRWTKE